MTPEEAQQVLASAEEQSSFHQWDDVIHLLRGIYDDGSLTGTARGDAAYHLGLAYLGQNTWDEAHGMFEVAASEASPQWRDEAHKRQQEFGHHAASEAAQVYGSDETDAKDVLAAGDESLARGDYGGAHASYWAVYNGHGDYDQRLRAALGIATPYAYSNELTEAEQYATYVADGENHDLADHAKTLQQWIHEQQGANTAVADGTTVNEWKQVMTAAGDAFMMQDWSQAEHLYESVLASSQLGTIEHAKVSYNLGTAQLCLGELDKAREHLEFAAANGQPSTVEKAQRRLAKLDAHDAAEALVDGVEEPDPDAAAAAQ